MKYITVKFKEKGYKEVAKKIKLLNEIKSKLGHKLYFNPEEKIPLLIHGRLMELANKIEEYNEDNWGFATLNENFINHFPDASQLERNIRIARSALYERLFIMYKER